MYPPRMLYEVARTQQAEDRARAESWRRRPARPGRGVGRVEVKPARRRLARLAAALAYRGRLSE